MTKKENETHVLGGFLSIHHGDNGGDDIVVDMQP
jgi:hypothetical protein